MGALFENEKYLLQLDVYEIKFIPDIEKEFNKLSDNFKKISEFGGKKSPPSGFLDGLGGISEQFLKLVAYKDSADVGTDIVNSFFFPLPNSLDETYEQTFQADNLNIVYSAYKYTVDNIGLGAVSKVLEDNLLRSNAIIDKNLLQIYAGSKPRNLTVSWNLVPRNKNEFELFRDNIMSLYNYSSAIRDKIKFADSEIPVNYLNQNNIFKLKILEDIGNGGLRETKMSKMLGATLGDGFFISNISTNMNLANASFRYDGSPSNFSLTLNFIERKPLWFSSWKNHIENNGIG